MLWAVLVITPNLLLADELIAGLVLMNNYNVRQEQDLWDRLRRGFRLNHPQSGQVTYYQKLYTKNPKNFASIINNAKPYIYYILTETERNGIPSEIALLPGVESIFNPHARSTSNAHGLWQFLPSTAKRFNMVENNQIDERRDLIKSTKSALAYLSYLHKLFGQWEPAIGAYNWGEGNMYRAVVNAGQTIGTIDYYNLNLRTETLNYLPKLIALASIIDDPEKFGVDLGEVENKPFFAIVNPLAPTSWNQLANQSGVDKVTFAKLNPQYKNNNYVFQPNDNILLPIVNQDIYYANIGKTTPKSLQIDDIPANMNQIGTPDVATNMVTTDELEKLIANLDEKSNLPSIINYTVVSGDTLYSIAKHFGVSIRDIKEQNKIPGSNLSTGQTIVIKSSPSQVNG